MYTEDDVRRVRDVFAKHGVEYMFIGRGAAIIQGFSDTTQDIDVYPRKDPENASRIVSALRELGFDLNDSLEKEILRGKDFVQFKSPFFFDLVFAPDGFESYEEASRKYRSNHNGYPVLSIRGIIHNKKAAGRQKDREIVRRLAVFQEYIDGNR